MTGAVPNRSRSNWIWAVGGFVVSSVVLVTYYPALQIGYWFDDYGHLDVVGRPSWAELLVSSFDPRVQTTLYRPIQRIQWRIEYMLWGSDAFQYHVVQNLFHLINCLLIFALVKRISRNWRVGFLGALIYAVLPVYALSVFWLAVPDPLTCVFYLLAIWLWVDFLENGGWLRFGLSFISFVLALLTKETALTLPITLLLVDRWLIAKPARWNEWAPRIAPFFLFLGIWALLIRYVIATKLTVESPSAVLGRWFSNLTFSVAALIFPWNTDLPIRYIAVLVFLFLLVYALVTRKPWLLFLGSVGLFSVAPMINLPGVATRYFYLPSMVTAVGAGAIIERALRFIQTRASAIRLDRLGWGALVLVVLIVTLMDSAAVGEAADGFSATARQARLQFRPIYQQHPSFAPNTLLYFIEPPFSSYNISGLMFLRYGTNVVVAGNDYEGLAGLRQHSDAYVFYPDEQGVLSEQRVDPVAAANVSPSLPAQFGTTFSLDGFEVVNTKAKPGESIILMLYWRARGEIDRDYTVFAHLLDAHGGIVAGYDSQPHRGTWPTTVWKPGDLVEDAIILPITSDVPAGQGYRIEVGLYYLPTSERLPVVEPGGEGKDAVVFSSFSVEP